MFKKELTPGRRTDPFSLLRQMTSEFDRFFQDPLWPAFRLPVRARTAATATPAWFPGVDVFEKDNRLVTRVDLPGVKKEDVKVEITDGFLAISGERKSEAEETKENVYRCEREYGSFHRAVPLPDGIALDEIKATFADGVLEVSVPLPAKADIGPRNVEIHDAPPAVKAA